MTDPNYRTILHSDLNSFFASVEIALNPQLRQKAVAVCGSEQDRHGIVLAKSELAKRAGIKTGMTNWQARQLCPQLIIVHPHYSLYQQYSQTVQNIYKRYSDLVEPYGMDECWIDVTASRLIAGNGLQIAEDIRQTVKRETSLTVSIGVSFNKSFAKLGSDLKKPDAITVISPDNFRSVVWPLPASDLLFVGRATNRKLRRYGICTIGELAAAPPKFLHRLLGKNGLMLWQSANGLDTSRVMPADTQYPIKSLSHGTTCTADLHSDDEVQRLILHLMPTITAKLLHHQLRAFGVYICVKDTLLQTHAYQSALDTPTQSTRSLAQACYQLFLRHYSWPYPVRALTVGATKLASAFLPWQQSLFEMEPEASDEPRPVHGRQQPVCGAPTEQRLYALETAIDSIRQRFGANAIRPAALLTALPLPQCPNESLLPHSQHISQQAAVN